MRLFHQKFERSKTPAVVLLVAVWLVTILLGGFAQIRYSLASKATGSATDRWPATTQIGKKDDSKQLMIFLHPKCACSIASIAELSKIQNRCTELIPVKAVFYCPKGEHQSWVSGELWEAAEAIDGCDCLVDLGAMEFKRFGVETSGHALLFDEQDRRIYSGGVTSSRGHVGDNLGASTLVKLIQGSEVLVDELPVFGCQILMNAPPVFGGGKLSE